MDNVEYRISGGGIQPESFTINELFRLIEKFADAIHTEAKADTKDLPSKDVFRIGSIVPGSCSIQLQPVASYKIALKRVVTAYSTGDFENVSPDTIHRLRKIQKSLKEKGASSYSFDFGMQKSVPWDVNREIPYPSGYRVLHGDTDLYVTVQRIGGKKPSAVVVSVSTGKTLSIQCKDKKQALELKEYLYKEVVLRGTARWDSEFEITDFRIKEIIPPPDLAVDVFEELAKHNLGSALINNPDLADRFRDAYGEEIAQ